MRVSLRPGSSCEGHERQNEDIDRSKKGCNDRKSIKNPAPAPCLHSQFKCPFYDSIFAEKPCCAYVEVWNTYSCKCKRCYEHGGRSDLHLSGQTSHLADVIGAHGMDNTSSTQEKQRLEECMAYQMEKGYAHRFCTHDSPCCAKSEHHVAELAHCGICQHPFDIVHHKTHRGCEQCCEAAYDGYDEKRIRNVQFWCDRNRCGSEHRESPCHKINSGSDHGCSMDQSRHGCGTFHCIWQPAVKRELTAFAHRTSKEQKGDQSQLRGINEFCCLEHRPELQDEIALIKAECAA